MGPKILLSCPAVIFEISFANGNKYFLFLFLFLFFFFADGLLAEVLLQKLGRLPTALP